jgi:uncharacterized protein (DUF983 family)
MSTSRPGLFLKAAALRCPQCGSAGVITRWFWAPDDCPGCGISLIRGNRVGAYILNLVVAELVVMGLILTVVVSSWPTPPWELLGWLAPALAVTSPLVFYPFAKLLFVALDLAVHPGAVRDEDPSTIDDRR